MLSRCTNLGKTLTIDDSVTSPSAVQDGSFRYETMVDELTPIGQKRRVNLCDHARSFGNAITFDTWVQYAPDPSKLPICYLSYVLKARPVTNLSYQLPAGDWSGLAGKLADQLNGRIDEGSLIGVSAIELAKTIAMIRNPFNLLKPDWRRHTHSANAHHTALQLARQGARKASSIWLEHRYGWNALWQDIKAIAKTTAKMISDQGPTDDGDGLDAITNKEEFADIFPSVIYNTGDSPSSWASSENGTYQWWSAGSAASYKLRLRTLSSKGVYRVGCKQKVDAAIRWSRTKRLINAYGLDASSIANVLWEIVPFSFVIDWFVDPLGIWQSPAVSRRLGQSDVVDLCHSLKIEGSFSFDVRLIGNPHRNESEWIYRSTAAGGPGYFKNVGSASFRKFIRGSGVPAEAGWSSLLESKDLTFIQRISGIALLAQKFTK